MTALSADLNVQTKSGTGLDLKQYPVEDNVKIYNGGLVAIDSSGYARPARNNATDRIVGVAYEQVDNTLTGHAAGGKKVRVYSGGHFLLTTASAAQAWVGTVVYALDDATVRQTVGNGNFVGIVTEYVSATQVWVFIPSDHVVIGIQGTQGGLKVAAGQLTTVSAADTVVTGLATVVAVVASLDDNPGDNPEWVSATIGDQAGAPAAGSIIIKTWQNTSGTDPTPVAATTFSKKVNWIAFGY